MRKQQKKEPKERSKLKIIPLGGIGEIGKNMTVIEWENEMIVIDCGLAFPREDMLGVDYVIPDTTYLDKNRDKIKGFFITHGHEDHIGATPYVLKNFNVPVYGARLTIALIEAKLAEHKIAGVNLVCVNPGESVKCGSFTVDFIKVSHSIDDAVGFAIHTPEGIIVHTGDFKVDFTPIDGKIIDFNKFAELGKKGVLALMADSTNAEKPGFTMSESKIGETFENYFADAKGRIVVATFSSNIYRLQQVIDVAKRYNRKICFSGRSMTKIVNVARDLGYLSIKDSQMISFDELDNLKDNKIVILTTGSQGEPMSGLVRMASGEHPKMSIRSGDLVIISASPIPGNERCISDVINMLYRLGANVVYSGMADVHVSGHACQEELKLIMALTHPKYFIPVHGEYRQLYRHAMIAEQNNIQRKNIFIPETGRAIELTKKSGQLGETVPSGRILIDGLGIGDVGNVVLRDRRMLSMDGLFIIVVTLSKDTSELISGPEIISRGFVYMRESEDLLEGARKCITETLEDYAGRKIGEWSAMKAKIKKVVSNYLYAQTKRSPMILPIIIEI